MDKEKINSVFEDLRSRGLLTKDGAFCMGDSLTDLICWILSLLVLLLLPLYGFIDNYILGRQDVPFFYGSAFFIFVWAVYYCWTNRTRLYWLRDRLVTKNIFGLSGKEYLYSDLKSIVRKEYNDNRNRYRMNITLYFRSSNDYIELEDDACDRQFLLSCFLDLFHNKVENEEIELRSKFFARILLRNKSFCDAYEKERQCAVRCLLSVKELRDLGYKAPYFSERLSYWLGKYKSDTKKTCVNECLSMCLKLMRTERWSYAKRLELLSHFFECMYAGDGMVDERELDLLSKIAFYFVIKDWDFLSLKYRFEAGKQADEQRKQAENAKNTGNDEDAQRKKQRERFQSVCSSRKREACNLLGVSTEASLEEVKSAYRKQVKTCHPDTLPPTATEAEREEATIRFRTITEAYDFLCAELCAEPVIAQK